ncbi:MAG: hypothetical protein J6U40_10705, partial [Kiritimatiellae bacterium]|nr:hypothetical protein [Kiritimatiellia bacterium]
MKTILFFALLGITLLPGTVPVAGAQEQKTDSVRLEVPGREMLAALNLMPSKGGIQFDLCNPENGSKVAITLNAGLSRCRFVPEEIFPALKKKQSLTFSPPELKDGKPVWATLKRTETSWIVYVNDQAVAWMP